MPHEEARIAALEILGAIDSVPIPTTREVETIRRDLRVLDLLDCGVPLDGVVSRLGVDRSTIYRAQARALTLKRIA